MVAMAEMRSVRARAGRVVSRDSACSMTEDTTTFTASGQGERGRHWVTTRPDPAAPSPAFPPPVNKHTPPPPGHHRSRHGRQHHRSRPAQPSGDRISPKAPGQTTAVGGHQRDSGPRGEGPAVPVPLPRCPAATTAVQVAATWRRGGQSADGPRCRQPTGVLRAAVVQCHPQTSIPWCQCRAVLSKCSFRTSSETNWASTAAGRCPFQAVAPIPCRPCARPRRAPPHRGRPRPPDVAGHQACSAGEVRIVQTVV